MSHKAETAFVPLNIAVLTVSDTRTLETDTSGQLFVDRLTEAGHNLAARVLLKDDLYRIRAQVATWIAEDSVQVVLITGGTGFTGRDSTPEAVACLLDKQVDGFGELFRQISLADIGTSTIQSRALAGLSNGTLVCCLPGSTNACRTAWEGILVEQLDARHRPCNFVPHLKQAAPCEPRVSGCCEQPGLMPVETALERLLELAAQTPIDTCEQVPWSRLAAACWRSTCWPAWTCRRGRTAPWTATPCASPTGTASHCRSARRSLPDRRRSRCKRVPVRGSSPVRRCRKAPIW